MKKLLVCDIDDCLLRADNSQIAIIEKSTGTRLSTDAFAKHPDSKDESKFDFSEFRTPEKVRSSIMNGKPLVHNLSILDRYVNEGYKVTILTARGLDDIVKDSVSKFLMYKDKDGKLKPLGKKFVKKYGACTADPKYNNFGSNTPEKKANILKEICKRHDRVVFIDDSEHNVEEARKLGINNLEIIKV